MTSAAPLRLPALAALAASVACLAAALGMAGYWVPAAAVVAPGVLLWLSPRIRGGWAGAASLVLLAAAGAGAALMGAPAWLAVPGVAAALAAWDLTEFSRAFGRHDSNGTARRTSRRHGAALAQAVGLSLLVAAGGFALSFRIPFVLMFALVVLDLGCLGYVLRALRK